MSRKSTNCRRFNEIPAVTPADLTQAQCNEQVFRRIEAEQRRLNEARAKTAAYTGNDDGDILFA